MLVRTSRLGVGEVRSPLRAQSAATDFVSDEQSVRQSVNGEEADDTQFERAGPRDTLFFDPSRARAAIVTCGGLCPGLNHVVRSLVLALVHSYGCTAVKGYRYGYEGLTKQGAPARDLRPDDVLEIHRTGGSFLGVSRDRQSVQEMVETLARDGIAMLFVIGGDGTLRGAHEIAKEATSRGLALSVVGIPKTIDNDVAFVDRTFGFETAVALASDVLSAAHAEARSVRNGVSIVQLMGRDAGFITASATLASAEVNVCLIPEVPFSSQVLLRYLEDRLSARGHALIAIAEGCGAGLVGETGDGRGKDRAAGITLKKMVSAHFEPIGTRAVVKYIDPSYTIRSVIANASDAIYCDQLARHAVHAAMSGRTDLLVGRLHREFVHVPLNIATSVVRRVEPHGELWRSVLQATGQPSFT